MKVFVSELIVDGKRKGDLFIESDENQYVVVLHNGKTNDKGKPVGDNRGYYSTLPGAAMGIANMLIKSSTAATLTELVQDIRRIEQMFRERLEVEVHSPDPEVQNDGPPMPVDEDDLPM